MNNLSAQHNKEAGVFRGWNRKYKTYLNRVQRILFKELNYFRQIPLMTNIELTYRCNLRCQMCGVWGRGLATDPSLELSYDEYVKLFRDLKDLKTQRITFSGGEPLLRNDIERLLQELNRLKIRTNIFTNATLLDEKKASILIENQVNKIIVSVDGFGDTHDLVRGVKGCFDMTISGVKKLIEVKKKYRSSIPGIDFHTVISNLNFTSLGKLDRMCKDLGVNFSFQPVSESDEYSVKNSVLGEFQVGSPRYLPHQSSLHLNSEDVLMLRKELSKLRPSLYTHIINGLSDQDLILGRLPAKRCFVTRDILFIDPFGNVFPCSNLDQYFLGNVHNQSIKKIWNNQKHRLLKQALKEKLFPICSCCCHLDHNLTIQQMLRILLNRKL